MNMLAAFARSGGYTGSSPAMLNAIEDIWRHGIREARAAHFERKRVIDEFKEHPSLFFSAIRPNLSTDEAIEAANCEIVNFRNLSTWRQELRLPSLRRAYLMRMQARFFRRFGRRIWIREAA